MATAHLSRRPSWLVVFGALTFSVLWHSAVCLLVFRTPQHSADVQGLAVWHPTLVAMAATALVAAVLWLHFKMDGKIGGAGRDILLSPKQFQSDCILALALSETCTIIGLLLFSLGAPTKEFALFAIGTLFVDFTFVLPRSLQFWAAHRERDDTKKRARRGTR